MTTNHCRMRGPVWHHDGALWDGPVAGTGTCHRCGAGMIPTCRIQHKPSLCLNPPKASAPELALHYATGKPSAGDGGGVCLVSLVFTVKLLKSGCFYSFFPQCCFQSLCFRVLLSTGAGQDFQWSFWGSASWECFPEGRA